MHSARQSLSTFLVRGHSARQSLSRLSVPSSARQSLSTLASPQPSARQSRSRMFGEQWHGYTVALNPETWQVQGRQVPPQPVLDLRYAGQDLTGVLGDLEISRPLNGKQQMSFDLRPPGAPIVQLQSDLVPPGYGPWAGLIRQHNGTAQRTFELNVSIAGETWSSTQFLPQPVRWDNGRISWSAEDRTALLEAELDPDAGGPPFSDVIRAQGDQRTAHSLVAEASGHLGIPIVCRYPNYLVGVCRRGGGTILSWLDALAKPMCAARRWVGNTLVYEQVRPDAPVSWRFVDRLNIHTLSGPEELPRAKNKFVLARFDQSGGIIGEASETGGGALGRKRISFTPSRSVVIDIHKCLQGRLDHWNFEAGGRLLNESPFAAGIYSGPIPADGASFTYIPTMMAGIGQWQPSYDISARGTNLPRSGAYRFVGGDAGLQSIYGVYPESKAIEEPVLGDEAGALLSLQAFVRENARRVWRCSFATPYLNPWIEPGQVIEVTDFETRQIKVRWVVELVVLVWSGRTWSMRLECARGEQ